MVEMKRTLKVQDPEKNIHTWISDLGSPGGADRLKARLLLGKRRRKCCTWFD